MSSQIRVAVKLLGAILLVGLALVCGFGFLASYELGSLNVWHAIYGGIGVAGVMGAVWLVFPAITNGRVMLYVGGSIAIVLFLAAVCSVACLMIGISAGKAAFCGALVAVGGFAGTGIGITRQRPLTGLLVKRS
jgi:hypothetical protein